MNKIGVYFSDYFDIDESVIDSYGAVNISLINDLPLFIDPFLLFNSKKAEFQKIHQEMIDYLFFLQKQSQKHPTLSSGMLKAWFSFSEVKETWLGFSLSGNFGRGMGSDFATGLYNGLKTIFKDFGRETVTKGHHVEKICLINSRVGRDKISDFTTNFAKHYLLEYTQKFARNYLSKEQCDTFMVGKAYFNWKTKTWASDSYYLPKYNGDYVLLTPKSMLTRDETFINRNDMIRNLQKIAPAISDDALRFELETYFQEVLSRNNKEINQSEKEHAAESFIRSHPELIDYYIKYKEDNESQATSVSKEKVQEVTQLFNTQIHQLIDILRDNTDFYNTVPNAYDETKKE